ncbi:MAG: hypothetical protein V5804_02995 [Mucilaginibacter sp.]|uniref:hypothetical protein n=1 Tax=Mucilaginibacter sp. TaxID=1882438 RepID=UPI0034E391AA
MLKLIVLLLLLFTLKSSTYAQDAKTDSLKTATIAVTDADKYLKINKKIRKAFRHKNLNSTSDYFKPTLQTTSNPKFLADSNYVKVYRHTAFESTVYQIPLNRTKVVIVVVVVAGVVVTVIVIAKIAEKIGNGLANFLGGVK